MKIGYLIRTAGISLSLLCLSSCGTHESPSSKVQLKTDLNIAKKDSAVDSKSVADKNLPAAKTTANKNSDADNSTTANVLAMSANDKIIADLTKKLSTSMLDKVSNSLILCSVNNVPITMGDYRRQFKAEQQQLQASITLNPDITKNLLQMALDKGINLSPEERKHLTNSATKMQMGGPKGFDKMLAENHLSKAQFRDQVLEVGIAFKMANMLIEEGLTKELVNRWLLSQAAKENGFSKEALNKYTEVSKSPEYKKLLAVSGISADELQSEIITNELCLREIDKIKKDSPLSDADISNYYEKNRGKFRHGGRVRISQIFISPGDNLMESSQEQKARLKRQNPGASDKDIEKNMMQQAQKKKQLAESILERARKGEDFASLANQYSEDLVKPEQKNGGDLGFQENSKLEKSFADKIAKIPAGGIVPEVLISPVGFHIFKVTEKESPGYYKLSEIKDTLKKLLSEEQGQEVLDKWLANARAKATIVISPEMSDLIASNKLKARVQ